LSLRGVCVSEEWNLFEGFVEIVQIVNLKSI
jgi:hypothetical protein